MNEWETYVRAAARLAELPETARVEAEQLLSEQEQRKAAAQAEFQEKLDRADAAEVEADRIVQIALKRINKTHLIANGQPSAEARQESRLDVQYATDAAKIALDELETAVTFRGRPADVLGAGAAVLVLLFVIGLIVFLVMKFI